MKKRSLEELNSILNDAVSDVTPVGSVWRHNKSGDVYAVICLYLNKKDLEISVIYAREGISWGQPLSSFVSKFTRLHSV